MHAALEALPPLPSAPDLATWREAGLASDALNEAAAGVAEALDVEASLRAIEIEADVIFKATKVDGVYSADPKEDTAAVKFDSLTYLDVLTKRLNVMDSTSVSLCMDNELPMMVFDVRQPHNIKRAVMGEPIGTTVGAN